MAQEAAIAESGLDWTIVKPPRLYDGVATGRIVSGENLPIGLMSKISRADVATFCIGALAVRTWVCKKVFVKNA